MKSCKKCGSPIPYKVLINGLPRYMDRRKLCLSCFPPPEKKLTYETKQTRYDCQKRFKQKRKIQMVQAFGGKCQLCGYNRYYGSLDFHHKNPSNKDISISQSSLSFEDLKKELIKCILVCSNCHREIHAHLISQDVIDKLTVTQKMIADMKVPKISIIPITIKEFYKYKYPSKNKLQKLVWSKSPVTLAKHIGCGISALYNFCTRHNIKRPPMGYWVRRNVGLSHQEALMTKKERIKYRKKLRKIGATSQTRTDD